MGSHQQKTLCVGKFLKLCLKKGALWLTGRILQTRHRTEMRGIGLFRASKPKGQKDDDDDFAITHERVSSRQNARALIEENDCKL